ncbi:MAG: hypothetical protein L3J76_03645 [Candidatus Hydrothermae bacterium]|nr:hypothetical protein [Candidatus Hydrothermae bacterium]
MMIKPDRVDRVLRALDRELALQGSPPVSLVVIGGAALNVLGLVERTTRDVDVLCGIESSGDNIRLVRLREFPPTLQTAAQRVQEAFQLSANWLNLGPASQFDLGLPEGFEHRLIRKTYGNHLTVYLASRLDQIHFKLFASVDRGGYHVADLQALHPSPDELEQAARWVLQLDVSEVFRIILFDFLRKHGYANVVGRLQNNPA